MLSYHHLDWNTHGKFRNHKQVIDIIPFYHDFSVKLVMRSNSDYKRMIFYHQLDWKLLVKSSNSDYKRMIFFYTKRHVYFFFLLQITYKYYIYKVHV